MLLLIMNVTTAWKTRGLANRCQGDETYLLHERHQANPGRSAELACSVRPLMIRTESGPRPEVQAPPQASLRQPNVCPQIPALAVGESDPSEARYDTCMTLYLRDIGRIKLLTPQEEVELAARVKAGDAEARDQMIKANLRLVVTIARHYQGLGVPLLDLISEGNIGLVRAVERFDPRKGAKLSTYGAPWIKQAIIQALASQSRVTRLPMHMVDKLAKLRRVAAQLEADLNREPTDEELAAELATTATRVAQWRSTAMRPVPLDASVDDSDSRTYAETIPDEKVELPDKKFADKTFWTMTQNLMETLTWQERSVLQWRYGLDGHEPKNLEKTGIELKLTDERVRQIQNLALLKLRRRIKKLDQPSLK